jgi:hypothetical protein
MMPRTNLHELANRLLDEINEDSRDGTFTGRLREVSGRAGLNSVRSAEAIKVLEESSRIEVVQRGRRGRDTIINVLSTDPLSMEDAEQLRPKPARRPRLNYEDIGRSVVDRLLELSKDDALRSAQVEAFASEGKVNAAKVEELESSLEAALDREADLRVKLRAAEEALERAEENMRRVFAGRSRDSSSSETAVDDDDARAVLDILRSTH